MTTPRIRPAGPHLRGKGKRPRRGMRIAMALLATLALAQGSAARSARKARPPQVRALPQESVDRDGRVIYGPGGEGGYPLGSAGADELQENRRIRCNMIGC